MKKQKVFSFLQIVPGKETSVFGDYHAPRAFAREPIAAGLVERNKRRRRQEPGKTLQRCFQPKKIEFS
jgi:hypothetical protein